ncbi:MAG TPA: outer membrane beta-barrel protein [Usitatibacteraceae bacterium]|mgnify:FL=1|jgi:OOP family OmpA-OmpF porin|nr:outer membrane beta-barrel protein [Usitatibacteraceae bacterium]
MPQCKQRLRALPWLVAPFAAALIATSLDSSAQSSPWYAGAALGQSRTNASIIRDREAAIGPPVVGDLNSSADLKDSAGKLWVGYRFSRNFALEGYWADHGGQRIFTTFLVPGGPTGPGSILTERDVSGFGLDLVASTPIANGFSILGKLGAFRGKVESTTTIAGDVVFNDGLGGNTRSATDNDTVLKFGVGTEYAFTPKWSARLEWERVTDLGRQLTPGSRGVTGKADMDSVFLGVNYRF